MPFVDIMTALYASQSVIGAFMQVERGASGCFLDCAMLDAAATLTAAPAALALSGFSLPRRMGSESDLFVPSKVFETADGHYIHVVALSHSHWRATAPRSAVLICSTMSDLRRTLTGCSTANSFTGSWRENSGAGRRRTGVTRSPRRADSALGCAKSKRRGPIRHCVDVGV
jgi:hypothetical protein